MNWHDRKARAAANKLARQIDALYEKYSRMLIALGAKNEVNEAIFSFKSVGAHSEVESILIDFRADLIALYTGGVSVAVGLSEMKSKALLKAVGATGKLSDKMITPNSILHGERLSTRVWKLGEGLREQMELLLDTGIREGKGAAAITKDLKKYLNDPDRLYRRVRDNHGELKLSRAAKDYHPGAGVYRSSHQNAMRLARTSMNRAYHKADHDRWSQMSFVVGIRVERGSSYPCPLCDAMVGEYPKDFTFLGWHPNCLCVATPILANTPLGEEDRATNVVKTPEPFNAWVRENRERISQAATRDTMPWFILENEKYLKEVF